MALFWKNIGQVITEDGSVDLMGCNLAQGDTGQNFIEELAAITHRNVAASVDSTGNGPNADWELEEGGVQLVGKYFDQQSIADYRGRFDAITLNGLEISDADGDGFYDIDSKEKLIALSQDRSGWDKNYELTANIIFDADHTLVDWNGDGTIDADDDAGFSPIGTDQNHSFSGTFDGNGHSITNLYINRENTDYIGLFGYYYGTAITDLSLNNIDITGGERVGGLIGSFGLSDNSSVSIKNIAISGEVNGNNDVGGLVGSIWSTLDESPMVTIANIAISGEVNGDRYVGGLVGNNFYWDQLYASVTIENAYISGDITGNQCVGGLVGFADWDDAFLSLFTIQNSFVSGNVVGNDGTAGGLIGKGFESTFTIENSYVSGDVDGGSYAGGLVGSVNTYDDSSFTIENSYAAGNIHGTAADTRIGGIIGRAIANDGTLIVSQSFHRINPAIGEGSDDATVTNEELTKQAVIERLLALRDDANKPIWTEVDASGNLLDDPILSDGSNHAPTLLSGAAWDISSRITQGIQVTELLEHFSAGDNDRDTLGAALAITANTGAGIFKYSTDDGNTWQTLDPGDAATSILLGATDRIRLVNNQGAAKTARFTLRAWDRSSGILHDTVVIDENNSGGTTAFSAEIGNLDVAIAEEPSPPVDPPVDPTPNEAPILGITEHDASGVIEQGVSVADILNMFEAEDPDGYDASLQMRITEIDAAHGIWQVKRAYYNTWQDLDMTTSRFLNPQDMIRFVPEPGYKEQVSLSFVAVDADFDSSNSATLAATPENHAPTLDTGIPAWNISDQIAAGITMAELLDHFSANDSDRDPVGAALAITENTGAGVFEYSTDDGNTWQTLDPGDAMTSILLGGTDRIRLTNEQDAAKTARFTLRAWDGSSGTLHDTVVVDGNNSGDATAFSAESGELQVTIAPPPNVAPVLGITERDASGVIEQGISVANILDMFEAEDPDGSLADLQMRITGIDATHGVWQVKRADDNSWQAFDVTTSQPLSGQDMIRFVPEPNYKEQVSLSFVVIDADLDSSDSAMLTATPINHKPQMEAQSLELGEQIKSSAEQIAADAANTLTVQQLFDIFAVTDADDAIETLQIEVTSLDQASGVWLYRDQGGNWQHITEGMVLSGTAEVTYNGTQQEDVAFLSFKVMDSRETSTNTATITISKPVIVITNPDDTFQVHPAFIAPERAGSPEYQPGSGDPMPSFSDTDSNNFVATACFAHTIQPASLFQDITAAEDGADDLAPSLAALKAILNDTNTRILDDAEQREAFAATLIDSIAEMFVYLVGRQNLDGKDMARLENLLFAGGVYEQVMADCRVFFDAAMLEDIMSQGDGTPRLDVANTIAAYLHKLLVEIVNTSSSEQETALLAVLENIFQTITTTLADSVSR